MSHYTTLGVPETASMEQVKRAFRDLAMQYHPDRHPGDKAKEARFKEMTAAYEVLSDPQKRAGYDQRLAAQREAVRGPRTWQPPTVPQTSRAPSSFDFWQAMRDLAVAAVPLIVMAAAGGGGAHVERGADGRPLPPRGPDGRFMSR